MFHRIHQILTIRLTAAALASCQSAAPVPVMEAADTTPGLWVDGVLYDYLRLEIDSQ